MKVIENGRDFKNAFKCKKCPRSNGEDGCPMWWEYTQEEAGTGQVRMTKECGYIAMPMFLTNVIVASNRPAEEIGSMTKQIVGALNNFQQEAKRLS